MTIFRVEHRKNYTVINNYICTDKKLSWKAKGIWLYAFSRPDDWSFHLSDLVNQSTDGITSVRAGLQELEDAGYLKREQKRENNQFSTSDYAFFEHPLTVKKCLPQTENPFTGNMTTGNQTLLSTEFLPSTDELIELIDPGDAGLQNQQDKQDPLLTFSTLKGSCVSIRKSEAFKALRQQNFSDLQINKAIDIMLQQNPKLSNNANIIKYLETIINNTTKQEIINDKRLKGHQSKLDPVRSSAETFKRTTFRGPGIPRETDGSLPGSS